MKSRQVVEDVAAARQSYEDAWRRVGAQRVPDFEEIVARYTEPHRAYHSLEHLLECLRWLAVCEDFAERPFEVLLGLVYHDVVYDPQRSDNEERSADLFRTHASASELGAECTQRIVAMIEGTASHAARDGDGAWLNDIDLAVLGASPHVFARYEQQIREEYQHVDAAAFRLGRAGVLRSFLETTSIFATPFFSQRLEAQARSNLARALHALHAPAGADS